MAIPILPILKSLPTIINASSALMSSLNARRDPASALSADERLRKLEDDVMQTGRVLAELAQQVAALAEQVRIQNQLMEAQARRTAAALWISGAAAVMAAIAVITVIAT